jgi:hypothetical protein
LVMFLILYVLYTSLFFHLVEATPGVSFSVSIQYSLPFHMPTKQNV